MTIMQEVRFELDLQEMGRYKESEIATEGNPPNHGNMKKKQKKKGRGCKTLRKLNRRFVWNRKK